MSTVYAEQGLPILLLGPDGPTGDTLAPATRGDSSAWLDAVEAFEARIHEDPDAVVGLGIPLGVESGWVAVEETIPGAWASLTRGRPECSTATVKAHATGARSNARSTASVHLYKMPADGGPVRTACQPAGAEGVSILADDYLSLVWRPRDGDPRIDGPGRAEWLIASLEDARPLPAWLAELTRRQSNFYRGADLWKMGSVVWQGGLAQTHAVSVLFGPFDSYKSFVALDLALHVATGRAWHGRPVSRGPVVYVAAEDGPAMDMRITAWADRNGVYPDDLTDFVVYGAPVDLLSPGDLDAFLDGVAQECSTTPALIVFDPLAQCMPGAHEATAMGAASSALTGVARRTGAAVLAVHHSGVSNTHRERGGSTLPAAASERWRIAETRGPGRMVSLTHLKGSHRAREDEPIELSLREHAGSLVVDHGDADTDRWARQFREAIGAYRDEHGDWPARSRVYRELVPGRAAEVREELDNLCATPGAGLEIVPNPNGRGEVVRVTEAA